MALLTVTQLREHLETDLGDDALQRILDAEEGEIVRRYGSPALASEMLEGGDTWLVLERTPASITSITETVGDVDTVLAADDYRLWSGGRLQRLADGTNPHSDWGDRATIVYVPRDESAQRTLALIQLCKLAVAYQGVKVHSVAGDYSETAQEYNLERERLLRSIAPRSGMVFA